MLLNVFSAFPWFISLFLELYFFSFSFIDERIHSVIRKKSPVSCSTGKIFVVIASLVILNDVKVLVLLLFRGNLLPKEVTKLTENLKRGKVAQSHSQCD